MVLCTGSYARWLRLYITETYELPCKHPDVHTYKILQWLVCSSQDKEMLFFYSAGSCPWTRKCWGQRREGTVGLTENPAALKRWTVAGPELARTVEDGFKATYRLLRIITSIWTETRLLNTVAKGVKSLIISFSWRNGKPVHRSRSSVSFNPHEGCHRCGCC